MPLCVVTGLDKSKVLTLSKVATTELAQIFNCPNDWINFAVRSCTVFCEGEPAKEVFVHVEWFDRGKEAKSATAKLLTEKILEHFGSDLNIAVIFVNQNDYYENGILFE